MNNNVITQNFHIPLLVHSLTSLTARGQGEGEGGRGEINKNKRGILMAFSKLCNLRFADKLKFKLKL